MNQYLNTLYWKTPPGRDEALERIYSFIRAMKLADADDNITEVFVRDMTHLRHAINSALKQYLSLSIEDMDWDYYESRDLSFEMDDPSHMDEDLVFPEFSGKSYTLAIDENVSIKLGLNGNITPIRLHFTLIEADELYYLRLAKITVE